jgi:WD40 repeat protein
VVANGHSIDDISQNCDMLGSASSAQWCPVAGVGVKTQMLLASGHIDGSVYLWTIPELQSSRMQRFTCVQHLVGHDTAVVQIEFSPQGRVLCTGCKDGTVCVWSVQVGIIAC